MAWNGRSEKPKESILPVIRNMAPIESERQSFERQVQQYEEPRESRDKELLRQLDMKLQQQEPDNDLSRDPVDNIASDVLGLTYGEMIRVAEGLWKAANTDKITLETLPKVLHDWATDVKKPKVSNEGENDHQDQTQG